MIPILEATKKQMLAKVDKRHHRLILDLVKDGEDLMWDEKTRHMTARALHQKDPADIGKSFAAMIVILHNDAGAQLPMEVVVAAGMLLLCEGLQFITDAKTANVTKDFLAEASQSFGEKLMELLGVTPERLQEEVDKAKANNGAQGPQTPVTPVTPQTGLMSGAQGGI